MSGAFGHRAAALLTLLTARALRSELNKVTELWRYPDATACMNARVAAREAPEWRAAIAKVAPMVQSFNTQFLNPVAWSPWQ
jgi:hypothetical protein